MQYSKRKPARLPTADSMLENFLGKTLKWIVLVLLFLVVAFPLYWLVTNSIKPEADYLARPPLLVPLRVTLDNYRSIFSHKEVLRGLYNTSLVAVVSTALAVLFGDLAAYALVKGRMGRLRHVFAFWFLVQKMYPAIAMAIPIYMAMRNLHLIDNPWALIIVNTSFSLPLVIWLMMGFFQEIPAAIEESGRIDGASMTQRFVHLTLPIAKTGIIASAILTFVNVWNEFLFAVILTVRNAKTLPVVISSYITDRGLDWGPMTATAATIIAPVLLLVWLLQKDFINGLVMGSVKG